MNKKELFIKIRERIHFFKIKYREWIDNFEWDNEFGRFDNVFPTHKPYYPKYIGDKNYNKH